MWKPCIALIVVCLIATPLWAQEPVHAAKAGAGVPTAVGTILPQHPRLYFRKHDLSWIRRRCATTHRAWYRRMKSHADTLTELGVRSDGVQHAMLYLSLIHI